MTVPFVVTEHPPALTEARRKHYERLRQRLEHVSGGAVRSVSYTDVDDLSQAPAVVLSGSFAPWAAHDPSALSRLGEVVRSFAGPVLGICAGMQLQAIFAGGSIGPAQWKIETGFLPIDVLDGTDLLRGLPPQVSVYHHHSEEITTLPEGFRVLASSEDCRVEAIGDADRRWWGTQFHPEEFSPEHPHGERVLQNFFELAK